MSGQRRGPRPVLNVYSKNLVLLLNVPSNYHFTDLRKEIDYRFGRVIFVETFEAWCYKKNGYAVLDFATTDGLWNFVNALENEDFLHQRVGYEVMEDRESFFKKIHKLTGIDLLACEGTPPSFDYSRRMERSNPPRYPSLRYSTSRYSSSRYSNSRYSDAVEQRATVSNGRTRVTGPSEQRVALSRSRVSSSTEQKTEVPNGQTVRGKASPKVSPQKPISPSLSHSSTATAGSLENNGQQRSQDTTMANDIEMRASNSVQGWRDVHGSMESLIDLQNDSSTNNAHGKDETLVVKNLRPGFDIRELLALVQDLQVQSVVEHSVPDATTARFVFRDSPDAQCAALLLTLDAKKFGETYLYLE